MRLPPARFVGFASRRAEILFGCIFHGQESLQIARREAIAREKVSRNFRLANARYSKTIAVVSGSPWRGAVPSRGIFTYLQRSVRADFRSTFGRRLRRFRFGCRLLLIARSRRSARRPVRWRRRWSRNHYRRRPRRQHPGVVADLLRRLAGDRVRRRGVRRPARETGDEIGRRSTSRTKRRRRRTVFVSRWSTDPGPSMPHTGDAAFMVLASRWVSATAGVRRVPARRVLYGKHSTPKFRIWGPAGLYRSEERIRGPSATLRLAGAQE